MNKFTYSFISLLMVEPTEVYLPIYYGMQWKDKLTNPEQSRYCHWSSCLFQAFYPRFKSHQLQATSRPLVPTLTTNRRLVQDGPSPQFISSCTQREPCPWQVTLKCQWLNGMSSHNILLFEGRNYLLFFYEMLTFQLLKSFCPECMHCPYYWGKGKLCR